MLQITKYCKFNTILGRIECVHVCSSHVSTPKEVKIKPAPAIKVQTFTDGMKKVSL